jgi:hypothetical protein
MPTQTKTLPSIAGHGARLLPSVEVDSYNLELKDDEGFLGDRASKGAFREIIENWRKILRKDGEDPFGDQPSDKLDKKTLDKVLAEGDPEAAGIVQGAIEEFSQELGLIIRRFLKTKSWQNTKRIVVGGGFRASRIGELVVGRTSVILKADGTDVELSLIRNHPDEAGLIGAAQLAPKWMFKAHEAILSKGSVWKFELWRYADEKKVSREDAVNNLAKMLQRLIEKARKEKIALAPFIGIGCPGKIDEDGSIERGAQNLPGKWEAASFHLPARIHAAIPKIGDDDTAIVMHNDAVVQGLSEAAFMSDVNSWGVLTIGTGLGNARFTNRTE